MSDERCAWCERPEGEHGPAGESDWAHEMGDQTLRLCPVKGVTSQFYTRKSRMLERAKERTLYRIRPLEWKDESGKRPAFAATPIVGVQYGVAQRPSGEFLWYASNAMDRHCDSIEHGKQLAEAHWRERLAAALEEVT